MFAATFATWEIEDFLYIEHFAVKEEYRNGGYGGMLLDALLAEKKRPMVLEVELPEDAYKGVDIVEHAENFIKEYGDRYVNASAEERRKALVDFALPKNIAGLERDLGAYRIQYDRWFKESSLHGDGSVQRVIDALKEKGVTYEQDGALWFKASAFGNDKDIVLVRANGIPTYIVPDIAYHYNKLVTRGYDKACLLYTSPSPRDCS